MSNNELTLRLDRQELSLVLSALKIRRDTVISCIEEMAKLNDSSLCHNRELELTRNMIDQIEKLLRS